jgi:tetratricopeptide (TPR) repeat protein
MHRLFLGFSLTALAFAIVLTGCTQSGSEPPKDDKVSPGESKPLPPGESKPLPVSGSEADALATKTDPDTLPVLPKLGELTGEAKYEDAMARAFMLAAENKDTEALATFKEAQAAQQSDIVKAEIERLSNKIARTDASKKAADAIKSLLDAAQPDKASQLATDALSQFGDSDMAETITTLKRQADAVVSAGLEEKQRGARFLKEAEYARKANNLRGAVLAYEQAITAGVDAGDQKQAYDDLRFKLVKYDENRSKAADLRKDSSQIDQAVALLQEAQKNWDTVQVQQEIADAEGALVNRKERVAVADFEEVNDIGVPRAGHVIAEELTGQMRPRYDVVERSQVKAVLTELKLDTNDLGTNDTHRTEFGKLAKARYLVLGSVSQLGGIHVNARLVDTQTGLVMQTARIVAATPEEMSNRLPALGRMLQMSDDEKRSYETELAKQAKPVAPPPANAEIPAPPPPPAVIQAAPAPAAPPPPPIVMFTPRPPEFGAVVAADFGGFRVVAAGAVPPPPVVVVEGPVAVRDRAFFVAIDVGDNLFRRGLYVQAMQQFQFAFALNPGHPGIRFRVDLCAPFCPPPPAVVVVAPARPRLVVLPFAEFRDPFASTIPPGLGAWTAEAIAPYFASQFDVVSGPEVYWWMGRLGLSVRDVVTDPYARLYLGRALGARFFLMGSLRDVASFDVSTNLIDAELNIQTGGATMRVQNAAELNFRLGQLASLTTMPPAQQVIVIQQQQVVQQKIIAAQIEFRKGNFSVGFEYIQTAQQADPGNAQVLSLSLEFDFRQKRRKSELEQLAEFQQQQAAIVANLKAQQQFMASVQQAQNQAQQNLNTALAMNQQALNRQNEIAEQGLRAQARAAQQAQDYQKRVSILASAYAIRKNQEISSELAQARAEAESVKQKYLAANQAHLDEARHFEAQKIQPAIEQAREKKVNEVNQAVAETERRNQAEYDRLVADGNRMMSAMKHAQAAAAFQTAQRIKRTVEVEQLISKALTEQARAEAAAKGAAEKAKFEAQLAQEEKNKAKLEAAQTALKAKYQAAFDQAKAAFQARQFEEAVANYRVAAAAMQTAEVTAALKEANAELAKAKEATAAEAKKKAHDAEVQTAVNKKLSEGRTALAAKKYDQAIAAFKAAVALKPQDVELQTALTEAETAKDQAQVAAKKDTVAKKDPMPDAATDPKKKQEAYLTALSAASRAFSAKKYEVAVDSAKDALAAKPGDPTATKILNDSTKALQDAKTTTPTPDKKQEAYEKQKEAYDKAMLAGEAALRKKEYDAAIKEFDQALKVIPGDRTATSLLKQAQDGKAEAASKSDPALDARRKQLYDAWLDRAEKLMAAKQYENAAEAYQNALKAMPGDATATKGLADAKAAMTAKKDPVTPKKDPVQPDQTAKRKELYDAWYNRGEKLMAAKQYEGAVEAFENCLKAIPNDPTATKALADAKAALTPKKDPVTPKQPMVPKEDPNAARVAALMKQGAAQENAQKYADAYQSYEQVLKLAPTNAEAKKQSQFCQYMDQGVKQLNAGKKDDAAASFQQALRIDPTDDNAKKLLAQAQTPAPKPKKK